MAGSDLEHIAANNNVKRLTVTLADNDAVPPVAAVMESDDALRQRVPEAFEGLSVAGPSVAYEFHAKSADGRVADASAASPAPAEVVFTVLSHDGDGNASEELLAAVAPAVNGEDKWPITTLTHTLTADNGFMTSLDFEVKIDDLEME